MATGLSPNQIASIARAQVAAALNPQVQALRTQGQVTDQQLTQQAQNARDAYNAVANLMRGLSGDVQQPYTQAAETQASLGKGFSQQFNQNTQQATDQANALLAQNNQPARVSAPAGQADVLYGLGGYNPATVLNTTGAALASAAANRPANTRLMGVQAYQAGLGKVGQNDLQTSANVAKLLATAPGLEQTAIDRINNQVLAGKKLDLQTSNDLFNQWARTQSLKQGSQRLSQSKAKQQFDEWATSQGLNIRWANLAVSQQRAALAAAKAATAATKSSKVKVPVATMRQARQMAGGFYKGPDGNTINLSGITGLLKQYNSANKTKYTVQQVLGNPEALSVLGVTHITDPQEIYTTIAHMGVPAITAFNIVGGRNKQWGTAERRAAYFPNGGKGSAAAETAAYRPGRKLSSAQLPSLAMTALQIAAPEFATSANAQALVGRIMQESGGNPAAINLWDSNAKAGHPSKGILQTIDATFNSYALPGHTDIWNPLDNAIAAVRYMVARYGHIVGPGPGGY